MSNGYDLIDKGNKTFYELGKGGWYVLNEEKEALTDLDYLKIFLLDDVFCREKEDADYLEMQQYANERLAPDLFHCFGKSELKKLIIIDRGCDDLVVCKSRQYKCIGTRFHKIGSQEHQEAMAHLNRHLNQDDPLMKRWYDPKQFNNPIWDEY